MNQRKEARTAAEALRKQAEDHEKRVKDDKDRQLNLEEKIIEKNLYDLEIEKIKRL